MHVLIACEFSGIVREAFRKKGHKAWSCDLLPTELPGRHIQHDVLDVIYQNERDISFKGVPHSFDLLIAHPPCTYLSVASAGWINRRPERKQQMVVAAKFFKKLLDAPIEKICIENPLIYLDAIKIIGKKYNQIIEPYQFGEPYKKRTCLWLKNLPELKPTKIVEPHTYWVNSSSNYREGKKLSNKGIHRSKKERSRTFKGIAEAMAEQWGGN